MRRPTMVAIKLTNAKAQTHGGMQWGEGVTHTVSRWTGELCFAGVLHCYVGATEQEALALALMMNPAHANFLSPRAWLCEVCGRSVNDGTKSGWETVRTVREIPVPSVTAGQYAEAAITVVLSICDDATWCRWAERWLDGADRWAGPGEAPDAQAAWAAWAAWAWAGEAAAADAQAAWEWAGEAAACAAWAAEAVNRAKPDLDIAAIVAPILLPDYEEADDEEK
jgi:hypothetical protein